MNTSKTLTLEQVASWKIPSLRSDGTPIASIPALQRGLVWKPHQVELLWDSILRGFPIGSLVVCASVPGQQRDSQSASSLHLLDGQQRSDAIALGYRIPDFSRSESEIILADQPVDILWIDLHPQNLHGSSTRQFLLRLTKKAHPWGYQKDDRCGLVSANHAREASGFESFKSDPKMMNRPLPVQIHPYHADLPIPLGVLLKAAQEPIENFTHSLRSLLSNISKDWAKKAQEHLNTEEWKLDCSRLWEAGRRSASTQITLLELPKNLLGNSVQESSRSGQEEGISNIEHLFQRLNSQGTSLSQEELAYSMIKAYLPEVADVVDAVHPLRMPPSRLVSLCVRVALSEPRDEIIHRGMNISRLRALASSRDEEGFLKIASFFEDQNALCRYCKIIDDWLLYQPGSVNSGGVGSRGMPAYLLSEIALKSPQIYLIFLYWAKKSDEGTLAIDADAIEALPGLATLLHWFSYKKEQAVDLLFKANRTQITLSGIAGGLTTAIDKEYLIYPHKPEAFDEFIPDFASIKMDENDFVKWNWWGSLIHAEDENTRVSNENKWWYFLCRLRDKKGMVLYAQRDYLHNRFRTYDQSNTELWEDHNRPWDYDHILAGNLLHGAWSKNAPYKKVCSEWINNIGNFWACPFEDNRSYGDMDLATKCAEDPSFLGNGFIIEDEKNGFNGSYGIRDDFDKAKGFCSSARKRLLRIYTEWFSSALIGSLISDHKPLVDASDTSDAKN